MFCSLSKNLSARSVNKVIHAQNKVFEKRVDQNHTPTTRRVLRYNEPMMEGNNMQSKLYNHL